MWLGRSRKERRCGRALSSDVLCKVTIAYPSSGTQVLTEAETSDAWPEERNHSGPGVASRFASDSGNATRTITGAPKSARSLRASSGSACVTDNAPVTSSGPRCRGDLAVRQARLTASSSARLPDQNDGSRLERELVRLPWRLPGEGVVFASNMLIGWYPMREQIGVDPCSSIATLKIEARSSNERSTRRTVESTILRPKNFGRETKLRRKGKRDLRGCQTNNLRGS